MSITFVFTALTRGEQSLGEALHGLRDYLVAVFLHFDLGVTDVNAAEIPYNLPGGFRLAHFGMHLDEVRSHLPDPPALQAVVLEASAIIAAGMFACDTIGAWLDPRVRV